jgi:CCR4-NOT transcription complex subunit 1
VVVRVLANLVVVLLCSCGAQVVQEAITRVLLERLIVHRPHPWGLLITFIELIKNPRCDPKLGSTH